MDDLKSVDDIKRAYKNIRLQVYQAGSMKELNDLYERASKIIGMSDSFEPTWKQRFGQSWREFLNVAEKEFKDTAHAITLRSKMMNS